YDEEFLEEYRLLFKEYNDICFRDNYSFELFKGDLSNVRKADDVVFQLKTKNEADYSQKSNILISVIQPSFREYLKEYDEIYYHKIKDIVLHFTKLGYSITLMAFCEYEGDKDAILQIMKLIPKEIKETNKINSF